MRNIYKAEEIGIGGLGLDGRCPTRKRSQLGARKGGNKGGKYETDKPRPEFKRGRGNEYLGKSGASRVPQNERGGGGKGEAFKEGMMT
jgi:hypothetical protein